MPGSTPLDPNDDSVFDGGSEYSWGAGLFEPGIANNEGQRRPQDDFGANMVPPMPREKVGAHNDNYARAVADRRTDSTDPESGRDFETLGNPDRYGGQPALVKAERQKNKSRRAEPPQWKLTRKP